MRITRGKKSSYMLAMSVLCFVLLCVPTFAGNGTGGGGGNAPLTLESSMPESGATDVSTEGKIELIFSNNVVNMKVSENNMTCFKLVDSAGNEVAIDVVMGDDQVDPTIKNNITIQSKEALAENETYKLIISPELTAKNSNKLGTETTLEFKTLSTQTSSNNTPLIVIGIIVVLGVIGVIFTKKNKK